MSFFAGRAATLLILAALSNLNAQQTITISGVLSTGNEPPLEHYSVELTSSSANLVVERTQSNAEGVFEFRNVVAGNYLVQVKTGDGALVGIHELNTAAGNAGLRIEVAEPKHSKPVTGTVAASTLQHRIPKKAVREMNAAIKASQEKNSESAQEHLRAAIRIDPDFSEAHTNLGAEYTRALKLDLAYSEFEKALQVGPKGAMQHCNLAVAALALNREEEAEREVRQSLQVDSRYPQANFLLGRILAMHPERYEEAIQHLKLASPQIASADALLAQIYAKTGRKQEAIAALETYKQLNPSADREKVQKLILSLR